MNQSLGIGREIRLLLKIHFVSPLNIDSCEPLDLGFGNVSFDHSALPHQTLWIVLLYASELGLGKDERMQCKL